MRTTVRVRPSLHMRKIKQTRRRAVAKISLIFVMMHLSVLAFVIERLLPREIVEDGNLARVLPRFIRYIRRRWLVDWSTVLALSRQEEVRGTEGAGWPQIFILNLPRTRARAVDLELQLNKEHVSYTLFEAVDGSDEFNMSDLAVFAGWRRKALLLPRHREGFIASRRRASDAERLLHERLRFGCYITHVRVWKQVLENSLREVLVLEDDVVLAAEFFKNLVHLTSMLPTSWDVLYLNSGHTHVAGKVRPGLIQLKGALGTFAYLISLSGARKLLDDLALRSDAPIDHVLDKGIYTGKLSAFQAEPPLAFHEGLLPSTIGYRL